MPRLAVLLGFVAVLTAPASATDLTIRVTGIRTAQGLVRICVFPGPSGFPSCTAKDGVLGRNLPARVDTVEAVVSVAPGTYAVTVFHDEKGTGVIETNLLGIPRSGVGASNDPAPRLGPPRFADAAFRVTDRPAMVTVTLRYP